MCLTFYCFVKDISHINAKYSFVGIIKKMSIICRLRIFVVALEEIIRFSNPAKLAL